MDFDDIFLSDAFCGCDWTVAWKFNELDSGIVLGDGFRDDGRCSPFDDEELWEPA